MSVCRKLPDGTIQKIAGHTILLDANASEVREGQVSFTNPTWGSFVDVTFSDPMPDTDYKVILEYPYTGQNWVAGSTPADVAVDNKTTTGFRMVMWPVGTVNQVYINWTAFKPVKIEGYTELQNKINNPDDTPTIDSMNLVTSDGVARAIENASAVWKGTRAEWNALPATDKKKYDLAVLLDKTLVKAVDREDGTETDVANLNKIVQLTEAEYDAMPSHDPDTYYMITDDTTTMSPRYPKPDWENVTEYTLTQLQVGITMPGDGLFVMAGISSDAIGNCVIILNGHSIAQASTYSGWRSFANVQIPVNKGDAITHSGTRIDTGSAFFAPWK